MAYVKSGWLQRQSTILRRWKRNWFDLWSDGRLIFYDDQHRRDVEDEIHMRVDCIHIRTGSACRDLSPPEGKGQDSLLQIVCRDGRAISICADGADDALAWLMALQDSRVNVAPSQQQTHRFSPGPITAPHAGFSVGTVPSAPPPYSEYAPPLQVYGPPLPSSGMRVVYTADGQSYAVAYPYQYQGAYPPRELNQEVPEDHRGNAGDMALGILAGAATGMALGSLFVF